METLLALWAAFLVFSVVRNQEIFCTQIATLDYQVNGVSRGNRFDRVTEGNNSDNQQNYVSKWLKSVTPFKELKTNKLYKKNGKNNTHDLPTELDTF